MEVTDGHQKEILPTLMWKVLFLTPVVTTSHTQVLQEKQSKEREA